MGCKHRGTRGKRSWELKERGFWQIRARFETWGWSQLGTEQVWDSPILEENQTNLERFRPAQTSLSTHFLWFNHTFYKKSAFQGTTPLPPTPQPKTPPKQLFFHFVFEHRAKFGGAELPPAAEQLNLEAPKELLQDGKFYTRKSGH